MSLAAAYRGGRALVAVVAVLLIVMGAAGATGHESDEISRAILAPFAALWTLSLIALVILAAFCALHDRRFDSGSRRLWLLAILFLPGTGALIFFTADWVLRD